MPYGLGSTYDACSPKDFGSTNAGRSPKDGASANADAGDETSTSGSESGKAEDRRGRFSRSALDIDGDSGSALATRTGC